MEAMDEVYAWTVGDVEMINTQRRFPAASGISCTDMKQGFFSVC
jgi:hypothetical protein